MLHYKGLLMGKMHYNYNVHCDALYLVEENYYRI